MSGLLASVTDHFEAARALAGGADIIDCKNPRQGALGALPPISIRSIVRTVDGRVPVSATVGDLPNDAETMRQAVLHTARCGVDLIKIGFAADARQLGCLAGFNRLARHHALIAVLFADQQIDDRALGIVADAGFKGVMLDTADKSGGPLTRLRPLDELNGFVARAHSLGLLCGLAGSLGAADIPPLLTTAADYLGFRTALCHNGRSGVLNAKAMQDLRQRIPSADAPSRLAL